MNTQDIINCWQSGKEPYNATEPPVDHWKQLENDLAPRYDITQEMCNMNTEQRDNIPREALDQMNREGWASIEEQKSYWQQRDKNLDRTESNCQWLDEYVRSAPRIKL